MEGESRIDADPVVSPEGFVSFPGQFAAAPEGLRNVIQVIHRPAFRDGGLGLEYRTDAVVVDWSGIDLGDFDPTAVAVDCDSTLR